MEIYLGKEEAMKELKRLEEQYGKDLPICLPREFIFDEDMVMVVHSKKHYNRNILIKRTEIDNG